MGALMRSVDWASSAVGPVTGWPQSLRTALSILLETGFPMYIAWGAEFTQFYNDGYRPILGSTKHPGAMGTSTRITFAEIWDIIGPMFQGVMAGTPITLVDFMLPLDRSTTTPLTALERARNSEGRRSRSPLRRSRAAGTSEPSTSHPGNSPS